MAELIEQQQDEGSLDVFNQTPTEPTAAQTAKAREYLKTAWPAAVGS